jgi:hypothetical protein
MLTPASAPGGIDDDFGPHPPLIGQHGGCAAAGQFDPVNAHALDNRRAVHARALGQRLGNARRVDIAIRRDVGRTDHAVGGHDGKHILGLFRADQMHFQPEALCGGGGALDLGPAVLRRGQT